MSNYNEVSYLLILPCVVSNALCVVFWLCGLYHAFGGAFVCDSYVNCFVFLFTSALVQIIVNSSITAKKSLIRMEELIM
jgi:hypothetical protein